MTMKGNSVENLGTLLINIFFMKVLTDDFKIVINVFTQSI